MEQRPANLARVWTKYNKQDNLFDVAINNWYVVHLSHLIQIPKFKLLSTEQQLVVSEVARLK